LALGASNVQVCTAVMHQGYRIVREMSEGLDFFLREKGLSSVKQLIGRAVPSYKNWGDLDMNHHVVASINPDKCIGCQLCYVACLDGSHQCIYLPNMNAEDARLKGHVELPQKILQGNNAVDASSGLVRVPWVDEKECVGCNLCELVCPIESCITMVEKRKSPQRQSWHERLATWT
jgi:dihydropyrimidine dehydrogenase (NAD+) subunit PreA